MTIECESNGVVKIDKINNSTRQQDLGVSSIFISKPLLSLREKEILNNAVEIIKPNIYTVIMKSEPKLGSLTQFLENLDSINKAQMPEVFFEHKTIRKFSNPEFKELFDFCFDFGNVNSITKSCPKSQLSPEVSELPPVLHETFPHVLEGGHMGFSKIRKFNSRKSYVRKLSGHLSRVEPKNKVDPVDFSGGVVKDINTLSVNSLISIKSKDSLINYTNSLAKHLPKHVQKFPKDSNVHLEFLKDTGAYKDHKKYKLSHWTMQLKQNTETDTANATRKANRSTYRVVSSGTGRVLDVGFRLDDDVEEDH